MMNPEQLIPEYLQYSSVQRWMRQLKKKAAPMEQGGVPEATLKAVKYALNDYTKFTGKNPDELIAQAIDSFKLTGNSMEMNDQLDLFYESFKSKTLGTRQVSIIKAFYKHNGISITCSVATAPVIRTKNKILNSEELRAICDCSAQPYRAMFLANNYMGLRIGAIIELTVEDFQTEEWTKDQPLYPVFISQNLSGTFSYTTYIGHDAMTTLKTYFAAYKYSGRDKPFQYTPEWINCQFKKAAYLAGIIGAPNGFDQYGAPKGLNELRFHTLRMRKQTIQEQVGTNVNLVDRILGHIPRGANGINYSHPSDEIIYEESLKSLPYLEIYGHHELSPTEPTVGLQRFMTIEQAKRLPNMTPEKLCELENLLKMTRTKSEMEEIASALNMFSANPDTSFQNLMMYSKTLKSNK